MKEIEDKVDELIEAIDSSELSNAYIALKLKVAEEIDRTINNMNKTYILVSYEEAKKYMIKPWFRRESHLLNMGDENPSSYFIPVKYV